MIMSFSEPPLIEISICYITEMDYIYIYIYIYIFTNHKTTLQIKFQHEYILVSEQFVSASKLAPKVIDTIQFLCDGIKGF